MEDKDLFIDVYRHGLAKRLLNDKVAIEFEKSFIGKIKMSCGPQYTSKLEGMITDMNRSQEIEAAFKKDKAKSLPVEFNVKVLTVGHWPSYPQHEVKLPPQLQTLVTGFHEWYTEKNNMKKLQWSFHHGICVVKGTYLRETGEKFFDFHLTTLQTSILMLFNESSTLTFE